MFVYDLDALSASGGRPVLRFANSPQMLSFLLLGELDESTTHYVAAVGIGVQVQGGHTVLSTDAVTVTLQEGYSTPTYLVEVEFDDYTEEYFAAVNGITGGRTLIFTLRGMDADEKETDYACFEITGIQSPNPPGYTPPPTATRPGTTINGLYGAVRLIDSAGTDLPASGNSIPITKSVVGLSHVQNILDNLTATAAPTATDDSAAGYAVGSRWIDVAYGKSYTCVDATAGAAVWTEGGTGGGDLWDYSSVTWPAVQDATYGRVRYLDAVYDELIFSEMQNRVTGFRALVVSNDDAVSGNMALIPVVATDAEFSDAIELPAQIVAVGTSLAEVSFDLEINRKFLKFRRDYGNALDTLADTGGTPITAIMINLARRISNA